METDMTVGKPLPLIIKFAVPIMIGQILQQLYNMADMIIVGRFINKNALAAVGATGSVMFLLIGFMAGLCSGFNVMTAQRFGAKDFTGMKKSVAGSVYWGIIISALGTALSLAVISPLLRLMNTPKEIFSDSLIYISVICAGTGAIILYNLCGGLLQALGNSKVPLIFLMIAAVINVALDLVFIIYLHAGVKGAAYATVLSQLVSGVLCVIFIIKKVKILSMTKADWKPDFALMKKQMKLAFPMAFQMSIIAIGTIVVQSVLNSFGSNVVAAFAATSKIQQLLSQPMYATGLAMISYCSQNYGKGEYGRIKEGGYKAAKFICIYGLVIGIIAALTIQYTIRLFAGEKEVMYIMEYSTVYMHIQGCFYLPLAMIYVFRACIQGMGNAVIPLIAGVLELVPRLLGSLLAVAFHNYVGVCLAEVSAWTVTGVFVYICFTKIINQKILKV